MSRKEPKLPIAISDYIKEHFREDFLFDVKRVTEVGGRVYYTVEVTKDNYIHTLKFNEKGELVTGEADEAFPADTHEEPGFGEVPE